MKLFQTFKSVKGFTLVELLIVIAVIGVLAIAVLAALDPIEQLKKSRDTAKLADARELVGAYQRFYATKSCFPADYPACNTTTARGLLLSSDAAVIADLTTMTTAGELKSTFRQKSNITKGWLRLNLTDTGDISVCYPAESKNAQSGSLGGVYTQAATGVTAAAACAPSGAYNPTANVANCMICVQ